MFEAVGCFYDFCPCQELRPSLTEEDIKRGSRKKELGELRRGYIQEKSFTVIEMRECEEWKLYKTTTNFKLHSRENFPCRRSLLEYHSDYSSALVLSATGACCCRNTPYRPSHSKEMFQQLCTGSSGRKKEN